MAAVRKRTTYDRRLDTIQRIIDLQAFAELQLASMNERMARADERAARADERAARADERMARAEEHFARFEQETKETFRRFEQAFAAIMRMLEALPDAVREKIGFASAPP